MRFSGDPSGVSPGGSGSFRFFEGKRLPVNWENDTRRELPSRALDGAGSAYPSNPAFPGLSWLTRGKIMCFQPMGTSGQSRFQSGRNSIRWVGRPPFHVGSGTRTFRDLLRTQTGEVPLSRRPTCQWRNFGCGKRNFPGRAGWESRSPLRFLFEPGADS